MIRNLFQPRAMVAVAVAEYPRVRTQPIQVVEELTALGLTEEASLGVLRLLLGRGRPAIDPSEM